MVSNISPQIKYMIEDDQRNLEVSDSLASLSQVLGLEVFVPYRPSGLTL